MTLRFVLYPIYTELSFCLQHSGGATNISPDSGVNAYNDNDDTYDEWDSYEPVPPPPPPPPAPPMPNDGNGQQQFQVRILNMYTIDSL